MPMFTAAEAAKVLDAVFNVAVYTAPGAPKLALTTTAPTATAAGTEVTGGSYAKQTLTMGAANTSTGANANTVAATYTSMPVATVTHVEVYDNAGTRRMLYGQLTASKTTASGDTLSFAIGAITTALT
jgi:hypothetical protein